MNQYLVEHYWPGVTPERLEEAAGRVRSSVDEIARAGRPVRYVRSTIVPEDELALIVLTAETRELVERVYERADVPFDRIVGSLDLPAALTRREEE